MPKRPMFVCGIIFTFRSTSKQVDNAAKDVSEYQNNQISDSNPRHGVLH